AAPKCALEAPTTTFELDCATGGNVATGGACTRLTDIPGDDDCLNGYCSAYDVGATATGRACRRYCSSSVNTCASGQGCWSMREPVGRCVRACDPFATNTCPQGNTFTPTQACDWAIAVGQTASFGTCLQGGSVAVGGNCNPSANPPIACVQGATCLAD